MILGFLDGKQINPRKNRSPEEEEEKRSVYVWGFCPFGEGFIYRTGLRIKRSTFGILPGWMLKLIFKLYFLFFIYEIITNIYFYV